MRSSTPQPVPPEGGFSALVGYLQQMLGASQYFVSCVAPKTGTEDGGFETMLRFEHEAHGQDVSAVGTVSRKRRRALVQFKFSMDPARYPVTPGELREISKKLRESADVANRQEQLPTDFVLRTNRPLGTRVNRKSLPGRIRYELFDPHLALQDVERYAQAFGVLPGQEMNDGIDRVINLLFQTATSAASKLVSRDKFDAALVGINHPSRLQIDDLLPSVVAALKQQRTILLGLGEKELLLPRGIANELMLDSDESLIVILGEGGCGKTLFVWDLLFRATQISGKERPAALITDQSDRSALTPPGLISNWRGMARRPAVMESPDAAISRIEIANPGQAIPVLLLGLDGIDETQYDERWHAATGEIIRYFWALHQRGEVPPARLYVTCRDRSDVEQFIGTRTGRGVTGRPPRFVRLTQFTDDELRSLCQSSPTLDPVVASVLIDSAKILSTASSGLRDPYSIETFGGTSGRAGSASARQILAAIRHPIIWHCFVKMPPNEQLGMLQASASAFDRLADDVLEWFLNRAKSRRDWPPDEVIFILAAVAKYSTGVGPHNADDWTSPSRSISGWADLELERLFREGVSSGLFNQLAPAGAGDRKRWLWRHEWLWARLKSVNL